jgi:MerR family transcriptional regulator, light-induced transcriptional regulator
LRTWEARYGVPSPQRADSGHRRYDEDDVALVRETQRLRQSGLSMPLAVERARAHLQRTETSVFAGVRRRHLDLRVQVLAKPVLLALCRAMEDECCAEAEEPLLFGAFQRTDFYDASRSRWRELSRSARSAIVFADFARADGAAAATPGEPVEVPVPYDSPLNREWVLVCDSGDRPGCLVGWERPEHDPEGPRRFETFWSVDASVVRDAARICARLSEDYRPGTVFGFWSDLEDTPPPPSVEIRRASAVLDRMVTYLSAASS